jgi:hypothetical protein
MKKIGTIFTTVTFLFVMAIASASVTATAADKAQDSKDSMASTDMGMEKEKDSAPHTHKDGHAHKDDHKEPKRQYNNDE